LSFQQAAVALIALPLSAAYQQLQRRLCRFPLRSPSLRLAGKLSTTAIHSILHHRITLRRHCTLLQITKLSKQYTTPRGPLPILNDINLSFQRGDAVAIMGPSGSGKSTLLYIVGALDQPSSGTVTLDGQDPFALNEKQQAAFRNQKIGFVFQDHCLLPQCSVLENVLAPTFIAEKPDNYAERAKQLLAQVGLSDRLEHRPAELSGGEKQRVAIARALIRQPLLLLCDEPTGNLDRAAAENVASLLLDLHRQQQTILLVVTHSAELAAKFSVKYELHDQQLKRV
jgi:lipoprotein-releasing system ATP-binding protein